MSLAFSDTTNKKGIIQEIEVACGFDDGFISGNTTRLKQFTSKINLAFDDFLPIAINASGSRQFDDSNFTDFPFIETDLIANQRDYTFSGDEGGNLVLEVYKVMLRGSDGVYRELEPIDQQYRGQGSSMWDGLAQTGTPRQYDKTGNGIILDLLPTYNWRNANEGKRGVKMFVNREPSYFVYTDTTKKPGVPGSLHRWFVVRPAEDYTRTHVPSLYPALREERLELEEKIEKHFALRPKDDVRRLVAGKHSNK